MVCFVSRPSNVCRKECKSDGQDEVFPVTCKGRSERTQLPTFQPGGLVPVRLQTWVLPL